MASPSVVITTWRYRVAQCTGIRMCAVPLGIAPSCPSVDDA
jgi:hypothetical protein